MRYTICSPCSPLALCWRHPSPCQPRTTSRRPPRQPYGRPGRGSQLDNAGGTHSAARKRGLPALESDGEVSSRWSRLPWSPPKLAMRTRIWTSRSASGRRRSVAAQLRYGRNYHRQAPARLRGAAGRAAPHGLRRHVGLSGLERHAAFHAASLMTRRGNVAVGPPARSRSSTTTPFRSSSSESAH